MYQGTRHTVPRNKVLKGRIIGYGFSIEVVVYLHLFLFIVLFVGLLVGAKITDVSFPTFSFDS